MPNRFAIEGALERGHLWAAMRNGRWWRLRRNGRTKLWKTRPDDFRVPVKAGLRACGAITHTSVVATTCEDGWRKADFVVSTNDPNVTTTCVEGVNPTMFVGFPESFLSRELVAREVASLERLRAKLAPLAYSAGEVEFLDGQLGFFRNQLKILR